VCLLSSILAAALLLPGLVGASSSFSERADSLYEAAQSHLRGRRMQAAERDLRLALQADSTHYNTSVALSRVHRQWRRYAAAERLLVRTVAVHPHRVEAPFEYARLRSAMGDRPGAIESLRQVIEQEPATQAAYSALARLLVIPGRQMDLGAAAAALDQALALDPGDQQAMFYRGQVDLYRGDWQGARGFFSDLLQLRPDHFATSYQLGHLHYRQAEYTDAARLFARMAEVNPKSQLARWNLWLAAQQLGGYPADIDSSLHIHPAAGAPVSTRSLNLRDVAAEYGVDAIDAGYGSAWLDADGDGDLDLFALGRFGGTAFYENAVSSGQGFIDQAQPMGLARLTGIGTLTADYDNDGDGDLFVTRDGWYGAAPNVLLRNDGPDADGWLRFVDVAAAAGVAGDGSSLSAVWGDLDNDGHLDLIVANGVDGDGSPNRVYVADGGGGFVDATSSSGVAAGRTVGSTLGDYDNDGDLDLYLAHANKLNTFYRNDSERGEVEFTDVTRQTRTQLPLGAHFAFFFDYDNDGRLDLFCSEMSDLTAAVVSRLHGRTQRDRNRPSLYWNRGDGSFEDRTYRAGLGQSYGTSGAHFGDFNGDGFPDIYLANGGVEMTRLEPDALLLNLGDGRFVDVAPAIGWMQLARGHGVTFADVDGDGSQEIYVPVGGAYPGDNGPNRLLHNDAPGANWLTVRLRGVDSNRDGIGARVRAVVGGLPRYAEVASGGGFGSSNSLQIELGLGAADVVDTLEVRWPSGVVDVHTHLAAGSVVELVEGEGQ
jgi:tetratricopeptide (TPR) repeat protein